MRSGECDVISFSVLCCSVNGSVCFVCCVFDSVCELFGETIRNMFGCVCYFVVKCDVELLSVVVEVLYWIDHVWSSKVCVCYDCGPSKRLDAPSISFVCILYVGSYLLI